MEKKPILLISTDWHLKETNAVSLLERAEEEIALAKELGVKTVAWLGDLFNSRVSQSQTLLNCLSGIIEMYWDAGIEIKCIPGNHDKTDYASDDSFLSIYKHHPGFVLYDEPAVALLRGADDVEFHFVPFYKQGVWEKKFATLPKIQSKKAVLFSHISVQGSINNDGTTVQDGIKVSMFKGYDKVFLGHYHNQQQPSRNVFHLPSVQQNDFGENEDKGFTILYDDLSFELVRSNFTPFREIRVDADAITQDELANLAKMVKTDEANVRVTFVGDQQSIKKINRKKFTEQGISVKVKYTEVEVLDEDVQGVAEELTGEDIKEKFKTFCTEKGYDVNTGLNLLNKVMLWQE